MDKSETVPRTSLEDVEKGLFASRVGKNLSWKNVSMTLLGKKGKSDVKILDNVHGEVPQGYITAIMGPSGAGKTSLLNILAGRTKTNNLLQVDTDVRLNNFSVDPTKMDVRKQIAFVAQDDSLNPTATPREAIRFSAKMRLPKDTTEDELDTLTCNMLSELGLTDCADTMIGGELIKGISGGERKRTSVGVELVVKPAIVFLDEPTSGLDSFSAMQLVEVLHKVAHAGSSVIFTIHQPASEIFNSFNHLILLNKGRSMYQGSVKDVPSFFSDHGYKMPDNYNPADWVMKVAQQTSVEELNKHGFFKENESDFSPTMRQHWTSPATSSDEVEGVDALGRSKHGKTEEPSDKISLIEQTKELFLREMSSLKRDKVAVGARFGITIFLNTLFGVIFYKVAGKDNAEQSNLQSHFGASVMILLSSMFGTAQPALFSIPVERPVFLREYSTNHYSVYSYFASRLVVEAFITFLQVLVSCVITYFLIDFQSPFIIFFMAIYCLGMASTAVAVLLGCAVDDAKLAQEMLPILFVPQMLFAGFFVRISLIPIWLQWIQYVCSLTYGLRLVVYYEFKDCADGSGKAADNCNELLDSLNIDNDDTWWYWVTLLGMFCFLRICAVSILKKKATKFF